MMRYTLLGLAFVLAASMAENGIARPERIVPNQPYYADEFAMEGEIAELGEERNFEEVFKNYEYYEAIYDERERPILFRAYRRGEILWTERYHYDEQGKLIKKEIIRQGKPPETIHFGAP